MGRGRIYIAFRGMDDAPAPDEGGNPIGLFFSGYYLSRPFKALKIRMDIMALVHKIAIDIKYEK